MSSSTNKMQIALITGGSSGIGLAIAHELAMKGHSLLLVSNQLELLEETKTTIEKAYNVSCTTLCIDLAQTDSPQQVFNFCQKENFEVEILVNNAGMLVFSEVMATPTNRVATILQLHMNTPSLLCRLFGDEMRKKKQGHILNVSSISSVMPFPGISLYGPSKTYMRYFTRAFRSEMKIYNVNVSCLLPGATHTSLYDPNRINIGLAKKLGIMQTPEYVAKKGLKSLFKKRAECAPGIINKLTILFVPLVPSWGIYLLHKKTNLISKGSDALN